jgi:hypothetical protein
MRMHILLCGTVLPALFLSSARAAQQFQAPSGEELKMTAGAKAPGADAVTLELRESDSDVSLRGFYRKVAAADQEQVVLAKTTAANKN